MSIHTFKKISSIRGMKDILPQQAKQWEKLESIVRKWVHSYGYCNLRTPILEKTQLFKRCIGEITDVVEKEMYSFHDHLNGDALTIRPEMTAGSIRCAIENNLIYNRPYRLYSIGPVFRHERPQAGRYRQFHQINVEALGFQGPDIDAELIMMLSRLWKDLKLKNIHLLLNTLGQPDERAAHKICLIEYLKKNVKLLDEDSCRRLETNPLRILDTKNPEMQELISNAPSILDFLGKDSYSHFEELCSYLNDAGIEYQVNSRLVRGLDYYNLTVFEWVVNSTTSLQKVTLCGGGRYDGLAELLGGHEIPAAGFAIGMERLLHLIMKEANHPSSDIKECDVYLITHHDFRSKCLAMRVAEELRNVDFSVICSNSCNIKHQFKRASNSGANVIITIGSKEVLEQAVLVKVLHPSSYTRKIPLVHLSDFLRTNMGEV